MRVSSANGLRPCDPHGVRSPRLRCGMVGPSTRVALILVLIVSLIVSSIACAAPATATPRAVPELTAHVVDQAGLLRGDQRDAIESKLAAFDHSNGAQIAVLTVPDTGDETIEQYSIRVVDAWKPGRKRVDDGALLLVSKGSRSVRIEVGRGLEGVIPDALANRIIDGFIAPRFKVGDFAGGIDAGIDRIIGLVGGGALPPPLQNSPAVIASPAEAALPAMTSHVVEQNSLLTPQQLLALDQKLSAYESRTGRKIAILLVKGTGDDTADRYAKRIYDAWKLGGAADDGVLFFQSDEPFATVILVGDGMARTIPPATADLIMRKAVNPRYIYGDFGAALQAFADSVIAREDGKPMPKFARPEGGFDMPSWAEAFYPPPFGTWIGTLVGLIFAFVIGVATLEDASAFRRGAVTAVLVGLVLLIAGAGIGFLLAMAAIAFYVAITINTGATSIGGWGSFYKDFWKDDGRSASVSGWSIAGGIANMLISSALSGGGGSGGGGGGFRGGGGGFSGGGASGRW